MKNAKLIDVIICDELRQENTGKLLVIGMYLDNIGVPRLPFVLPVLTFLCKWRFESGGIPVGVFKLVAPSGRVVHTHRVEADGPQPEVSGQILMPIRVQPFEITETGEYRLSFRPAGGRTRAIARFTIHTAPELSHEKTPLNRKDAKSAKEEKS